jgi:hypothetical protein
VGSWYQWEGGRYKERVKEDKYGKILYTHVCKWKMRHVETTPGMEEGRIKENDQGGELNYDTL